MGRISALGRRSPTATAFDLRFGTGECTARAARRVSLSSWRRRLGARHASTPSRSGGGGSCCRGGVWGVRVASGCTAVARRRASAPRFALLKQLAREAANRRRFALRRYKLPFICSSAPLIACQQLFIDSATARLFLSTVSKMSCSLARQNRRAQKLQERLARGPKNAPWLQESPPQLKFC